MRCVEVIDGVWRLKLLLGIGIKSIYGLGMMNSELGRRINDTAHRLMIILAPKREKRITDDISVVEESCRAASTTVAW